MMLYEAQKASGNRENSYFRSFDAGERDSVWHMKLSLKLKNAIKF